MQKVLPLITAASQWPEVAEFETATRARLGLPVPEHVLEAARLFVWEIEEEDW